MQNSKQKGNASMLKSLASAVLLTTLLIGCATGSSSYSGPALVEYSKEFQARAAVELESIKTAKPHVTELVIDYGTLRDQVRAGRL